MYVFQVQAKAGVICVKLLKKRQQMPEELHQV